MRSIKSEFLRIWSMPETYIAIFPIGVLSLVFSVISIDVINAILTGNLESQNLDLSLASKPLSLLLSEGYLGSVYQSAVIFIPLAVAYLANFEYRYGEHEEVILNSKNLVLQRVGTAISMVIWSMIATLAAAIINFFTCLLLLDSSGRTHVSVLDAFVVCSRVFVFAILFTTLALAVTALTRRLFPTIIILLALFMVSLSGIFHRILPPLHNALPLIGGKSFAFNDATQGPFSIIFSLCILVVWISSSILVYLWLAGVKRR